MAFSFHAHAKICPKQGFFNIPNNSKSRKTEKKGLAQSFMCSILVALCSISVQQFVQDYLMVWTNLLHRTRFFGRAILLALPIGHVKNQGTEPKCTSDREATSNQIFILYYVNRACRFHFEYIFIEHFCNFSSLYVVLFLFLQSEYLK